MFEGLWFDIVDQPYSINFVPDCRDVFGEVARAAPARWPLGSGDREPFRHVGAPKTTGARRRLFNPGGGLHRRGENIYADQDWVYDRNAGGGIPKPVEYRQSLSRVINGLIECGFGIEHFAETVDLHPDTAAEPQGSWDHYVRVRPAVVQHSGDASARPAGRTPGRRPPRRRTTRACGSSARAARAGAARRPPRAGPMVVSISVPAA